MLEDFLSKLGASTKITVGVAISPGLGLEMIEIDRLTGTVNKYANRPLEYNSSSREIPDYDLFKSALEELFDELHIPRRTNIVLSLPSVHFGLINLPLLLTDDAVTNAIISEAEQSYIFKRQEPVVSWCEVYANTATENRTLAYSAIQKEAIEQINQACEDIGCTLAVVENSYSSLFRALHYIGATKDEMKDNVSWNLMLIMQNNYSIISMSGKSMVEYYEEPLALKSFVDDEIYNAIKTSAQLTLAGLPANYLYIVSETDLVSAEVLSLKVEVESTVKFLECNKFIQNELLPINLNILPKLATQITPEAIGTAIYPFCDYPLKLNAIKGLEDELGMTDEAECPKINVGNLEVELTPDFMKKITLIIGGAIIVPTLLLLLMLSKVIIPGEQDKLAGINVKIEALNKDIEKYKDAQQDNSFDLRAAIKRIGDINHAKIAYYSSLGLSVPKEVWLTYYEIKGEGKVDITGEASNVEGIYNFYKNLKQSINNSDIRLYKLEVGSGSIDDVIADGNGASKLYNFQITNKTEDELKPKADTATATQSTDSSQTEQKQSFFSFGKKSTDIQASQTIPGGGQPNMQPNMPQPAPGQPMQPGQQSNSPFSSFSQTPQNGQLPANLKKIESF